jgi:hypothetical protein
LYKKGNSATGYPWDHLFSEDTLIEQLEVIAKDNKLESRLRLLANYLLLSRSFAVNSQELLGVIIEVPQEMGLDVLATFSDGTARYINQSEKLLVWETKTERSDELIGDLFKCSMEVVRQIGPWKDERRRVPEKGMIRMSFLVADGLYFGEGPFEVMQNDPMGAPVINAAVGLMMYLIESSESPVQN